MVPHGVVKSQATPQTKRLVLPPVPVPQVIPAEIQEELDDQQTLDEALLRSQQTMEYSSTLMVDDSQPVAMPMEPPLVEDSQQATMPMESPSDVCQQPGTRPSPAAMPMAPVVEATQLDPSPAAMPMAPVVETSQSVIVVETSQPDPSPAAICG